MREMVTTRRALVAMTAVLLAALASSISSIAPARADDIVSEWANVKAPPPPEVKPVTVDPKTTALLLMDFIPHDPYCGPAKPRCAATLPAMKQLLAAARAAGATVIYSVAGNYGPSDIAPEIAPQANETTVKSKSDKFLNTDLEKILKDKGVQTVVVTGNSANGSVLYTGTEAALRGFKVIVPVDGLSAPDLLGEQVTVWQLANGPGFGSLVTITKSDMIKF
jgi:nicotinamidase-related amidase